MEGRFPFKLQENARTKASATYTFCHKKESKMLKPKELLNDKEDKEAS